MKSVLLLKLSAVIVLTSLFSCQTERVKQITDDGITLKLSEFTSNEYGFTIEYPSAWEKTESNPELIFGVRNREDQTSASFHNTMHISMISDLVKTPDMKLENATDAGIADMTASFKQFTVTESTTQNIGDSPSIRIKCQFLSNDELMTFLLYYVKTEKHILLLAFSSPSDKFNKYEKIYDYLGKSFKSL